MAVPKQKTSKAKTRSRKAANMKFRYPTVQACPICETPSQPHRVCSYCGYYKNTPVVPAEGFSKYAE